MFEARLSHVETEKLSAECELQDLLQNNTALEADLTAVRIQLEEAQRRIDERECFVFHNLLEANLIT